MSGISAWSRVTAWAVAVLCLLTGVIAITFEVLSGGLLEWGIMAWLLATPVFGLLLIVKAGAARMGWLFLSIGIGGALAAIGAAVPSTPENLALLWLIPVSGVGWVSFLSLNLVALPLLFPTGTPPSRRWRPLLWSLVATLGLASVLFLFAPELSTYCAEEASPGVADCATWEASGEALAITNCDQDDESGPIECDVQLANPIGIAGLPHPEESLFGLVTFGALLAMAVLSLVSMGFRIKSASPQERQQIKYLFIALGFFVLWTLVEALLVDGLGVTIPVLVENLMEFFSWTAIPVCIYLAITRYRLYDIDRIISRTVTYAVVVGLIAGVVALVATMVSTRFDDPLVVAATTLGVAAIFNPLRRRVQRVVDRRFNRSRYDAERVMDDFAATLRDEVDEGAVVDGWQGVVSETMHPSSVAVWVR